MSLLSEDREPFRLSPVKALTPDDTDLFAFGGSVGPNGENRRDDVIKAQTLLKQTGDFQSTFDIPTGWPSSDLWRGIKAFQKGTGLDADGTLLPLPRGGVDPYGMGETVYALRGETGGRFAGQKALTPQQVDAHYEQEARFRNTVAEEAASALRQPQIAVLRDARDATPPAWRNGAPVAQGNGGFPQRADTRPGLTVRPAIPPEPAHKKDIFARPENKEAWRKYHDGLHQQAPGRSVLHGVLGGIYADEGARTPDPKSGAVGGILPGTLDDMRARGKLPQGLPAHLKPGDLTPGQQAAVGIAYFDDVLHTVGGVRALEDLPPAMAAMLGDALFLDGRGLGTRFLQQGINAVLGDDTVREDGQMGPQTWAALGRLSEDPSARNAWLNETAEARINGKLRPPGEADRISRLRPDPEALVPEAPALEEAAP